jgi:tetratricopeptide (TPR) repeat protein/O-antigen ligase
VSRQEVASKLVRHQEIARQQATVSLLHWLPFIYMVTVVGLSLVLGAGMFWPWSQLLGVLLAIPAMLVVVLQWSRSSEKGHAWIHDPLIVWPLLGILLLTFSFAFSVYKWASLVELCKGVALAALFWFSCAFLSSSRSRRRMVTVIFGAGVLLAAVGLALYAARASTNSTVVWLIAHLMVLVGNRLSIGFQYPNTFAAFLLMPIGVGIGLVATGRTLLARIMAAVGTGVMMVALLASGSRGGLLALVLLILVAPVLLTHAAGRGRGSWKWMLLAYGGLAAAVAALFVVPALRQSIVNPLLTRLAAMLADVRSGNALDSESLGGRLMMVLDGFRYVRAYPVLGSGAGTYNSVYMQFRTTMFFSTDPHSILVKVLTETGWVGLAVFGGIVVTAVRRWWSTAMAHEEGRVLSIALLAGAGALLLHACIDWDFAFFSLPILLVIAAGMGMGHAVPVQTTPSRSGALPHHLWTRVAVWALVGCWSVVSVLLASGGMVQATAIRQSGSNPEAALKGLQEASFLDPLNAEDSFQRAQIGAALDKAAPAGPLSDRALTVRSDFERAIRLNGHFPKYPIEYGRYLLYYRLADAVRVYEDLITIDPRDPGAYAGLALSYLTVYGNVEKAQQWLTQSLSIDPKHSESHLVQGMLFEKQKQYERAAAEYRLAADLDTTTSDALVSLGAMRQGQGDTRAAIRAFFEAYQRVPGDASIHARLAAVAPVVDVLAPAGGTMIAPGQDITIRWIVSGRIADAEAWNIVLAPQVGDAVGVAADLKRADRSWTWHIPATQAVGTYRLLVYARAPSKPADAVGDWLAYAISGWFTVR